MSAAHQVGIREVIAAIAEHLGAEPSIIEADAEDDAIRVGIIGKPNVGKSTFVNRILGEDRMITSPEAGTTRDSIDVRIKREGQEFIIVDTAGLRKKARVPKDSVERYSGLRTLRALAESDVAVLLLDATDEAPTEQDAKIAGLVHDRGIPLLLVVNKWDAIEKDHRTVREYTRRIYDVFKFARYAPVIFVSSLTGKRCPSVLEKAKEVYEAARVRISTGELNRLMNDAFEHRPPPVYRGEPIKLYFATQIAVAPPTIVLFVNHPKRLPFSYLRYLKNIIRKHYPYEGSNIKLLMRKRSSKEERLAEVAND